VIGKQKWNEEWIERISDITIFMHQKQVDNRVKYKKGIS
jgi:hypothetical protein